MAKDAVGVAATKEPKFLERVLDAIAKLAEKNGSSAKEILRYVLKNNKTFSRNVTVQVQQALKHAVREGQIMLRGGRYKILTKAVVVTPKTSPAQQAKSSPKSSETPAPIATKSDEKRGKNAASRKRTRTSRPSKTSKHEKHEKAPVVPRTGKKESRSSNSKSNSHSESSSRTPKKSK